VTRRKASKRSRPTEPARPRTASRPAVAPERAGAAAERPERSAERASGAPSVSRGFLVPAACLLLLTLVAYLPALGNGFIWDDDDYVTANPTLRSLDGLFRIWLEPGAVPQYYPLTFTSLWIDYHLGGLEPFGYHLVNVLLHAANAVLAWRILLRLEVPGAWLAAALFAVHPVHVESVAWVTERKNVLSGLFYLGALLSYLRFEDFGSASGAAARTPGRRRAYALSLVLFVAGLLSKTVVATLPATLLLLVWWKRGRLMLRDAVPLVPFLVLGAALALVTVSVERAHVGAVGRDWDLSFVDRCLIAGRAVWFYLGKLAWPDPLVFIYPRWTIDAKTAWQYAFPVAGFVLAGVLFALRGRIGLGPFVALAFFVFTLGPALGFVNVFPMRYSFVADHFQYLASLGPIALAAALGAIGLSVASRGSSGRARTGVAVAAVVLAVLTARTWAQARPYRDLRSIWTDTLAKNPDAWMAHNNLGLLLADEGQVGPAMEHFRAAIAVKADDSFARNNLGRLLAGRGDLDGAIVQFREAVALEPSSAEAWSNLGNALAAQGRFEEAAQSYQRSIAAQPRFADAYSNLGNVLFLTGNVGAAIAAYENAVRLDPAFADARYNFGVALASADRLEEAAAQLSAATQLRPTSAEAHHQLGLVRGRQGRFDEAAVSQREALRLRPEWPEAQRELDAAEISARSASPGGS
jgi:protein O-mannosyl-transferase